MYKLALKLIAVCEKLDSQCDDEVLFKQKPSIDPTLVSILQMNMFRFLGVLMGIAIRTGSPLSLKYANLFCNI